MGKLVQSGSINCEDFVGVGGGPSPSFGASRDGRTAKRTVLISWSHIGSAFAELFPAAPALPGTFPGISSLYAESVEVSAFPPTPAPAHTSCSGNVASYTYAILEISYATLRWDPTDRISRRSSFSTDVMLLPSNSVEWEDGSPVEQADVMAAMQIPMIDVSFTFHRVPLSAVAGIRTAMIDLQGKVNKETYRGFKPETVLYKGSEEDFRIDSAGNQIYQFSHGFQIRQLNVPINAVTSGGTTSTTTTGANPQTAAVGWNHFFRNRDSVWTRLRYKDKPSQTRIFQEATNTQLNALFQ